jgi:hypothetical protein
MRLAHLGWRVDAVETAESIRRREAVYSAFAESRECRVLAGTAGARTAYDLAVVTHVLEFVEEPAERRKLLRDIAGRLTNSAVLLLSLRGWSDVKAARRAEPRGDGIVTGLGTWARGYTVEEANAMLAECGLEAVATPHPRSKTPEQVRLVCRVL